MRDLIITLPAKNKWSEYRRELQRAATGEAILNFKLPSLPRQSGEGARCYLVYQGALIGYMNIVGLSQREGFTCDSTNIEYEAGVYVQRSGPFFFFRNPPAHRSMRGFNYYDQQHGPEEFLESYDGQRPSFENS